MELLVSEKLYGQFFKCFSLLKYKNQTELPIGPGQLRVLAEIAKTDNLNQKAIQEKFEVRASSVSNMLAKLEKYEFIVRTRDSEDKRNMLIQITDKGREFVDIHYFTQKQTAQDFFGALTQEEQEELSYYVLKLIKSQMKE